MRNALLGVALFAGYALIGPSIAMPLYWLGVQLPGFLYDLVSALWPMWGLAAADHLIGALAAGALAVLGNVLVFSFIGLVVGLIARSPVALGALFLGAAVAQVVLFQLAGTSLLALAVAGGLFALPFLMLSRLARAAPSEKLE